MKNYFFSRCLILIIALSFFYSCASLDRTNCTNAGNFAGVGKCSAAGDMVDSPSDMGPGD